MFRFPPLNKCKGVVDSDIFMNTCLQQVCDCLEDEEETDTTCKYALDYFI